MLSKVAELLGNIQAEALRFDQANTWLNDLDKDFINLKEAGRLKIKGKELIEDRFIVLKKIFRKQVAEPFSGARYFGEQYKVPISDHFSIAKPLSKDAIQHRLLFKFIKSMLEPSAHFEQHGKVTLEGPLGTKLKLQDSNEPQSPRLECVAKI